MNLTDDYIAMLQRPDLMLWTAPIQRHRNVPEL